MNEIITIVGSGNWGSTIAKLVGKNQPDKIIKMWVYDEIYNGEYLSKIINKTHINEKYLPGIVLPDNIIAIPNLDEACKDATILIFVLPSLFLDKVLKESRKYCDKNAIAVSLIKSMYFKDKPLLVSDIIREYFPTSVMMGANIAKDVAKEELTESTLAGNPNDTKKLFPLFNNNNFIVTCTTDYHGVEIFGCLKNVLALGCGFIDGMGMGGNTKATIFRVGIIEMLRFCKYYYPMIDDNTIFESCGIADMMTTCYGGRHRKCAEEFIKTRDSWDAIEEKLLNGQKLQGSITSKEMYNFLKKENLLYKFPIFISIYKISFENADFCDLLDSISKSLHIDKS